MATAIQNIYCTTTIDGRLSNVSNCTSTSSISDQEESTQIHRSRSRRLMKLMKKVIEGSKRSIYGSSKPMKFGYDAVSYSLNFDEGNHDDEYYSFGSRSSQVLG
ncbi:hypothetical protein LXL04_006963 [Taraxacum kok-saghyz]